MTRMTTGHKLDSIPIAKNIITLLLLLNQFEILRILGLSLNHLYHWISIHLESLRKCLWNMWQDSQLTDENKTAAS